MKIVKPIFIVGTGRCGSTALHRVLGVHPGVMWLSGFAEQFPEKPLWNRWAVTAMGNRALRRIFRARIKPVENASLCEPVPAIPRSPKVAEPFDFVVAVAAP